MFYSINNREIIENETVNECFYILNHIIKYDDTYFFLSSNNNSKTISINYDLIVNFRTTIERYPFITLLGISFIIGSIFLFYYTIISIQREYQSLFETKDIVCKSKSLNKQLKETIIEPSYK